MPGTTNSTDYMVVRRSDVNALRTALGAMSLTTSTTDCASGRFSADVKSLGGVREAFGRIRGLDIMDSLRRVPGAVDQDSRNLFVVVPPSNDEKQLVEVINKAINSAHGMAGGSGTISANDADLYEALASELASSGILLGSEIEMLRTHCWNERRLPVEPRLDDPDWIEVKFSSSSDEPDEMAAEVVLPDGSLATLNSEVPFEAFIIHFEYRFPRSDRYGVPMEATDAGARAYVVGELGFHCAKDFEVQAEDSGDDSPNSFVATARIRRDALIFPEKPATPSPRG